MEGAQSARRDRRGTCFGPAPFPPILSVGQWRRGVYRADGGGSFYCCPLPSPSLPAAPPPPSPSCLRSCLNTIAHPHPRRHRHRALAGGRGRHPDGAAGASVRAAVGHDNMVAQLRVPCVEARDRGAAQVGPEPRCVCNGRCRPPRHPRPRRRGGSGLPAVGARDGGRGRWAGRVLWPADCADRARAVRRRRAATRC